MNAPKILYFFSFILVFYSYSSAQIPESFNFQAVASDSLGNVYTNQTVNFKISIRQSNPTGLIEYSETHLVQTDKFGCVNLNIGEGVPVFGVFFNINWAVGNKFLQIELDKDGGNNFIDFGASRLLSVPYAVISKKAESLINNEIFTSLSNDVTINSTSLINIPQFNFFVDTNEIWTFEFVVYLNDALAGLKFGFSDLSNATIKATAIGNSMSSIVGSGITAFNTPTYRSYGTDDLPFGSCKVTGIVYTGNTSGQINLQSSRPGGGSGTILAGSYFTAKKR